MNITFTYVHYPFILDTQVKSEIVLLDCRTKMKEEIDRQLMNHLFHFNLDQAYLNLEIRRDLLVEDALNNLVRDNLNFKKPLKVKFVNEPGIDEGGVQKEFFQLLIK